MTQSTSITEWFGSSPFANTIGHIAQQNPQYAGTLDTSWHHVVPSDTTMLGSTSPESSTTLPASSAATHTTDPESSVGSGVDLSILPASSMLPLLATADESNSWSDLTSMTLYSTSLTFVRPNKQLACIDHELPYDDLYDELLPYSPGTPMDDAPLS